MILLILLFSSSAVEMPVKCSFNWKILQTVSFLLDHKIRSPYIQWKLFGLKRNAKGGWGGGYLPTKHGSHYRLVSNIRRTSNIRCTPTLGNSQLEFSPTISLAKTSNTRRTPSFDFWVSIVDKVRSRPTWSELLRVAWDFDSPWIKGPINDTLSVSAVCETCCINTCCEALWLNCNRISFNRSKNTTQSPPIHRRQRHFVSACWLSRDPYDPDDQRFHHASRRKLCGIKRCFDKITSICDKLSISNYIFQA